jgi:hypothetical protein
MSGSITKMSAIMVVGFCLIAADAQACGELMLRSVGAMRYHAFVTRHPATILLYSHDGASSSKRPAATDPRLHDSLEKVGHKVSVARGPGELAQALATHRYNLIIGYADDMAGASNDIAKASPQSILIPVLDSAANERQMRERFPRLVVGNFNDLLKAIERAMSASKA